MDAVGISRQQCWLVGDYLLDTGGGDHPKGIRRRDIRCELDRLCLYSGALVAVEQLISALRLALDGKFGGCGARDGAGQLEKFGPVATLGLDLDLAY